jgi:PAS domain S-box-containing protein
VSDLQGRAPRAVADHDGFRAAPVALAVVGADDHVTVDANEAFLELVARSAEEVLGRHILDVCADLPTIAGHDQLTELRGLMERAVRERCRVAVESLARDSSSVDGSDGLRRWSVSVTPLLDAAGNVTRLLQSIEDVTDLFRARDALARIRVAKDEASGRVTRLSDVALSLRSADTVDDLVSIVVEQGLEVLGADGGGLVTRAETGDWLVSSSEVFDADTQQYAVTPFDTPLAGQTAARTGVRVLLRNRDEAVAFHPVMADVYALTEHTAWAFLPLLVEGRSIGAMMAAWVDEQCFDDDSIALMEGFAAQCAVALDRIEKTRAERRNAELVRDLAEALQSAMLTEPPTVADLEIAVRYRSASDVARVGGDWYDSFLQPDGALMLVIGDVAGHDDVAAGKMSQLRGLLRALAYDTEDRPHGDSPATVLGRLERVARGLGVAELSTAILARVDGSRDDGTRTLHWSNAGNAPPVLLSPSGGTRLLDASDLLLGVDPDTVRHDHATQLEPGSVLLLYTDGLIERRGASIDAGLEDLRASLSELRGLPVEELLDQLLVRLGPHLGEDDVALIAIRT